MQAVAAKAKFSVSRLLDSMAANPVSDWAWDNFTTFVSDLIRETGARSVLEIGGGRFPMFSEEEIESFGGKYTSNDISPRELDKAPDFVSKACFNIATKQSEDIAPFRDRYDFAFSKMVFEHVRDVEQAYKNLYEILVPGGICVNFHPVLFSPPFLINLVLPDKLSRPLLSLFFKERDDDGIPKFPAYYNYCYITDASRRMIERCGFSQVWQLPFYGHGYFTKIPVLREIDNALSQFAKRGNHKFGASYSYTVVQK